MAGMVLGIPDYFTAVLYARDGEVLYAMAVSLWFSFTPVVLPASSRLLILARPLLQREITQMWITRRTM